MERDLQSFTSRTLSTLPHFENLRQPSFITSHSKSITCNDESYSTPTNSDKLRIQQIVTPTISNLHSQTNLTNSAFIKP